MRDGDGRRVREAKRLDWKRQQSYDRVHMETPKHIALSVGLSVAIVAGSALHASAQMGARADPDWPCPQVKVTAFSLASIWDGPPLDLNSQSWRDDPEIASLAEKMSERKVPIADVKAAITAFKAKTGADADAKLLRAFAAAFEDLSEQRSRILAGLDRFGRKQHVMADRIRAEADAVQKSADQNQSAAAATASDAQQRLQWDLRVFDDRRQTVRYVCETPTEIEQRIGAIARAVQSAL
jgi:hypothetical protein